MTYEPPENTAELVAGWFVAGSVLIWMPLGALWVIRKAEGSNLKEKLKAAFLPAPKWGPYLEEHRNEAIHAEIMRSMKRSKTTANMENLDIPTFVHPSVSSHTLAANFEFHCKD